MILSAATVCLVPEASAGPFVFHGDLRAACETAASLGFDAIEIFAPGGHHVDRESLRALLSQHGLLLAAVGTGAGMVVHGYSLCDAEADHRQRAREFVKEIIDFGAPFAAPAIIGSMQGQAGSQQSTAAALEHLADSLRHLADYAGARGQRLLFEPLNRYETDLVKTLADGVNLIQRVGVSNLKLLADLFHMNIEETSIAEAISNSRGHIGHVHFVDSNRRAAGFGHLTYEPIVKALISSGYDGYASVEALPLPDSYAAAQMTIRSFRRYFPK